MMAQVIRAPPGLAETATRFHASPAPSWLQDLRRKGWATFAAKGLPTTQEEDWRYTDVSALMRHWTPSQPPTVRTQDLARFLVPGLGGPLLVFVNGVFQPALSRLPPTPGLVAGSLLTASAPPELGSAAPSALEGLNAAFLPDVGFVRVEPKTVLAEPVTVLHATVAGPEATLASPRTLFDVGPRAEASFVEIYGGIGDPPAWTNAVTWLRAADDSVVDHTLIQRQALNAYHTGKVVLDVGRGANVTDHVHTWGAALARHDLEVVFRGEGGETVLNGLYAPTGTQHVDHHTSVDHAVPRCQSQEFYKGVLDGRARGVFYGKVLIRKDAQKTNAAQTNKNLILSREALADSTPALEINADDVKASHGSTTGQLDAGSLFYLRSRGLDAATARSLLTYAFAADVIQRVKHAPLRAHLESLLLERLPKGAVVKEVLHEVEA